MMQPMGREPPFARRQLPPGRAPLLEHLARKGTPMDSPMPSAKHEDVLHVMLRPIQRERVGEATIGQVPQPGAIALLQPRRASFGQS
jgi:hypothetical protein